jgi:zinc protease
MFHNPGTHLVPFMKGQIVNRLLLFLVLLLPAAAAGEAEVYTLDNGLTVVLEEMHFAPTVMVLVQYQVGSRNETSEISGISHFTEHMLFNGTENMPGPRFWQLVQREGGMANAGTGKNQTTYFIYFPSSKLEQALMMEADRMQNCLMDSADIAQEIGVVMDEWRLGQDSPDNQLYQRAYEAFYGDHPLAMPIIGTSETIASYTEDSVRKFYQEWYRPSNAILTVTGAFDTEEARELVSQYFGPIQCSGPSPDDVPDVTELEFPARVEFEFPAENDRFMILFRGCRPDSPDLPALWLLATHFSSGRLGWMERELVNTGLLNSGYASSPWGKDENPFSFYGVPQSGVSTDSMIGVVIDEAFRLTEEPIGAERLQMLQNYLVARELTSVDTPIRQAYRHAYSLSLYGDIHAQDRLLEAVAALSPEDVRQVAAKYFTPERMMVTVLTAAEGGRGTPDTSAEGTTETVVPEVTDWSGLELATDFQLPETSISHGVESFTLNNGMTLLVKEDHSFPIIEIIIALPMAARREIPEKAGISSLLAELMLRGAAGLGYEEFHENLAVLGSSISLNAGNSYTMGNIYGLNQHSEVFFSTLADLILRPTLSPEDFISVQQRLSGRLAMGKESHFNQAFNNIDNILLAPENARIMTDETVSAVTHQDVLDWYEACFHPSETVIAVVGSISSEEALSLVNEFFGQWSAAGTDLPDYHPYEFSQTSGDTLVISMPGRIQVAEIVAARGPASQHPDYMAFATMNRILGGGLSSRLGKNIRETQGLAYAVSSMVDGPGQTTGLGSRFMVFLATGSPMATRALDAVSYELELIIEEGIQTEELLLEKSRAIGRHAIGYDSYDSQARYLAGNASNGLPLNIDIMQLEETIVLTGEDIQRVARDYLSGPWFVIVAGGVDEDLTPLD